MGSQARGETPQGGILAGMRVVELSAFVAVPLAGLTLSSLGADVIRVDPPGGGLDYGRWPVTSEGRSLYWAGLNAGKRSVNLDMRSEPARSTLVDLITAPGSDAGIFITNLSPPWLSYERLAERRPDMIMVTLQGSSDGSVAVDYTVNAAVGYPEITGPPGAGPVNHVLPAWDVIAGHMVASGVLAAERHRLRTGEGQVVHLSLTDVALATVSTLGHIGEVMVNDHDRGSHQNYVFGAYGRDFATSDGRRLMVVVITDRQWDDLVEATGSREQMRRVERRMGLDLRKEGDRFGARDEISTILEPWFAARTLAEAGETLGRHRLCWGPYQSFRQLVTDDPRCSLENPLFENVEHPGIGKYLSASHPLRFGAGRVGPRPAPAMGQHTEEVLLEVLGKAGVSGSRTVAPQPDGLSAPFSPAGDIRTFL
ncbi:MAG: 2-methylfumaryl-CoA isomerase [Acidimicrobiia bacterium]|nr:2-methylfumaryl-CoA isomerase [Acidimicrobiia bacterium]